jgi:two-component system sensor histidine kinase DesK
VRSVDFEDGSQVTEKGARGGETSRWTARIFVLVWLVYLAYPLSDLFSRREPPVQVGTQLLGTVLFVTVYIWVVLIETPFWKETGERKTKRHRVAVGVLSVLAVTFNLVYGSDWAGLFVYASVAAGISLPSREARGVIAGLAVLTVFSGFASGLRWTEVGQIVLLVGGIGFGQVLWARLFATVRELRAARAEIARLAVAEERLRFARDLHDLLGHSLSLITVKSEVAGRLLSKDPARAAAEVRDIEEISRRALGEVREAVSGYRRLSFDAELENARGMLESADVFCEIERRGPIPEDAEDILGWVVREGATNVVRHSRARRCEITVGCEGRVAFVEVCDDGRGGSVVGTSGSGLCGLAERVEGRGGSLEAGPLPSGGFRLRAEVPAG